MIKLRSLLFVIIFFIITCCIGLYVDIDKGKNTEVVKLKIITDTETFNKITADRIAPSGFESSLVKDSINSSFYSNRYDYLKNIKLIIPDDLLNNIHKIEIVIGKKNIHYSKEAMLNKWTISKKNNHIELVPCKNVYLNKSVVFSKFSAKFNKLINWRGDIRLLFFVFIKNFIFYTVVIIILFILSKIIKERNPDYEFNNTGENLVFLLGINEVKTKYSYIYYFLVFAIIFIAVLFRFSLNILPYSGNDTWGYIGPAVEWFDSGKFMHVHGRSFTYPLFILALLKFFNSFSYITIIQHLTGIITGCILLYIWNEIIGKFNFKPAAKLLCDILGLVLLGLFLFSESVIVLEHHLQPEALYSFFVILQVLFIVKILFSFSEKNKSNAVFFILFFINNYFLSVFQPRWGFTLFFNLFVFLFFLIFSNKKNITKIIIFVMPVLLCLLLIYLPENVLIKNTSGSSRFFWGNLFWAHSKIVDIELKKDIDNPEFDKYSKDTLKTLREFMHAEFDKKQTKHKYLGFYFNRLFYGKANRFLNDKFDDHEYKKFCEYYYKKAVINNPLKYAKKVLLELSHFYNFYGGMYSSRLYKIDYEAYNDGFQALNKHESNYLPFISYKNSLNSIRKSFYNLNEPAFPGIHIAFFILSKTYIICFILFFVFFIINILRDIKDRKFSNEIKAGILICILFFYNFCISLTCAMTYSLDVSRYIDDQYVIVLLSNLLAMVYVIYCSCEKIKNLKFKENIIISFWYY